MQIQMYFRDFQQFFFKFCFPFFRCAHTYIIYIHNTPHKTTKEEKRCIRVIGYIRIKGSYLTYVH
jgi:hypothetical protein